MLYDAGNSVNRKKLKISRTEGEEKMGPCMHIRIYIYIYIYIYIHVYICSKVDAPYTGNATYRA